MSTPNAVAPVDVTLFGKRVFSHLIQVDELKMRSSRPTPNDRCPTRRTQGDTQTQRRSLMKTEAEAGGTGPQPGIVWGPQRLEEAGRTLHEACGGRAVLPPHPRPETSGLQSWEGKFLLLKSICGSCHSSPRTLAHAARRAWPRRGSGNSWVFQATWAQCCPEPLTLQGAGHTGHSL